MRVKHEAKLAHYIFFYCVWYYYLCYANKFLYILK